MKKWVIFIILIIFLAGCVSEEVEQLEGMPKEESKFMTPRDFAGVEGNIDFLIEAGNMIGPDHYEELKDRVDDLEESGEDVSVLREKLAKLLVPSEEKPKEMEQDEIMPVKDSEEEVEEETNVPECDGQKYTVSPLALDEIKEIWPLGNLGPPGHTIPTEHIYILPEKEYDTVKMFDLFAPGDIYIANIASSEDAEDLGKDEYVIRFFLCKDIQGVFLHVKVLSEELKAVFDKVECEQWTVNPANICSKNIFHHVKAGTKIGEVARKAGMFDFETHDKRILHDHANKDRYGIEDDDGVGTLHAVCPLDYYEKGMKEKLYVKLVTVGEPACGEVLQDVKGTLAGNWYNGDAMFSDPSSWDRQLSFAHHNKFPSVSAISIGGFFTDSEVWEFAAKSSGNFNRKFSDVRPDGNIYCYEAEPYKERREEEPSGKIIVQMVDDAEIKIEHQDGSCTGSYQFEDPKIYNR